MTQTRSKDWLLDLEDGLDGTFIGAGRWLAGALPAGQPEGLKPTAVPLGAAEGATVRSHSALDGVVSRPKPRRAAG